jgi:hypothetical protein
LTIRLAVTPFKLLSEAQSATPKPRRATLAVRIPSWAQAGEGRLTASADDGATQLPGPPPTPGRFFHHTREWRRGAGDSLTIVVPLGDAVRAERVLDDREPFKHLFALLWGPLALAALTEGPRQLVCGEASREALLRCVRPVTDAARGQLASLAAADGRLLSRGAGEGGMPEWLAPPAESPGPARRRLGGTDAHSAATWRVVALGSDSEIALEAFDRPGSFLCAKQAVGAAAGGGGGGELTVESRAEGSTDPLQPGVPSCGRWL